MTEQIPRNIVGRPEEPTEETPDSFAGALPDEPLTLRWFYTNRKIQLFERRMHSLKGFGIGPAHAAWVRTRCEWIGDNRLREMPEGFIVIDIDGEGNIDVRQEEAVPAPAFTADTLVFEGDKLAGASIEGTLWVATDEGLFCSEDPVLAATDTLARDLATTLGAAPLAGMPARSELEGAGIYITSDAYGIIVCEGYDTPFAQRMVQCFDKMWSAA